MSHKLLYVTSTITTLFIYLYFCCLLQHSNCAKLDLNQLARRNRRHLIDRPKPMNMLEVIKLLQNENFNSLNAQQNLDEKRIGLGLSRGYSGTQAAKHLLGITAANQPNSPGRRRRSLFY